MLSFSFMCCIAVPAMAQEDMNMSVANNGKGYILYACNTAYFRATITLELNMTNFEFSKEAQRIFLIPARTAKMNIGELKLYDPSKGNKYT